MCSDRNTVFEITYLVSHKKSDAFVEGKASDDCGDDGAWPRKGKSTSFPLVGVCERNSNPEPAVDNVPQILASRL